MPIATLAYTKNLQQCKAHNIAVEDHYIENQLNQFRLQLQKQHKLNKMPEKKINSLFIDNTNIMESLESTQKHIKDFYNTPIEALQEVNDLFEEELQKQVKLMEEEETLQRAINMTETDLTEPPVRQVKIQTGLNKNCEDIDKIEGTTEDNFLDFMEKRKEELNLDIESIDINIPNENEEVQQRTPSPLANTDEVLKPLREALAEQNAFNLKCVRFDTEVNVYELKRETSICSNTSDGIDSVISELAEEALKELEMEDLHKCTENSNVITIPETNLNLIGSSLHATTVTTTNNDELVVVGQVTNFTRRSSDKPKDEVLSPRFSDQTEEDTVSNREQTKIIEQLFQSRAHTNISIMRKYFLKWIHYTTIEKIEREHVNCQMDRVKKMNMFLDKIRMEKSLLKRHPKTDNNDEHRKHLQKRESMQALQINKKYQNK